MQDDFANKITPTSGMKGGGDENAMSRFWDRTWNSVTFANTIISNVGKVEGLDPTLRDEYLGRAYFHRAYAYYHGVLLFGDIPLITKLIEVPKQNYKSTSKEAIFQMLVHDLEFAVKHVSPQKEIGYIGTVNQEACKQLLIKCYLVVGEYQKAEQLATDLINNHGLALMNAPFGTNVSSGNPETWPVERNVIWDLHRGVNITDASNTEMIMPILNYYAEGFISYPQMRAMCVHWSNGIIRDPHNLGSPTYNYARTAGEYDAKLDWVRAMGRGIGCFRTSYHYNQTIWNYDGETDWQDLRHNRQKGNWVEMTDLKYNNPESDFFGENMMLYAPDDYYDEEGKLLVKKGDLLCSDFEHIDFFTFCDDVIHAHNTLASQYVVDGRCQLLYAAGQFRTETSRCDFCYFAFVFGVVIEEFVQADYFCDREYHFIFLGFVASVGQFDTVHESFNHHIIRLLESSFQSRLNLFLCFHLCHTEAGTAGIGLDEARQADFCDDILITDAETFVYQHGFSPPYTE